MNTGLIKGMLSKKNPTRFEPSTDQWRWYWRGATLILLIFAIYLPVWRAGFIWDDDAYLTNNPCVVGPLGFKQIWTTPAARICPLVISSFWFEHKLWDLNPLFYHLVNVGLHAVCAVLLWRVLLALNCRGAWLGAALWALHPVQVESVAWITEQKNTQSGLFYLMAVLFFSKWARGLQDTTGRWRNHLLAVLCAGLAMASKSSTVILPLVLGLCLWWLGSWTWRNLERLWPFFLLSLLTGLWSIRSQQLEGGNELQWVPGVLERVIIAGRAIWFYLAKLCWPHPLIFIYPRWSVGTEKLFLYLPILAMGALLFVLWRARNRSLRPLFFAFTYFVIALLPVLGLVPHYFLRYSFVGDHFQYLASMGPLALAGAGLSTAPRFLSLKNKTWEVSLAGALLLGIGFLSWRHAGTFRNDETLLRTTIERNPASWMASNNLATALVQSGRIDEGISYYQRALAIRPDYAEAEYNLGNAFLRKSQPDEALAHYQKALERQPDLAAAHHNLGNILLQKGRFEEAAIHLEKAAELVPNNAEVHRNLATAFLQLSRLDEAITQYRKSLELDPDNAEAHSELGNALTLKERRAEAIAEYEKALQLRAVSAEIEYNLATVLFQVGRIDEAISHYKKAIGIRPGYEAGHANLGNALAQKGRWADAIAEYQTALQINPNNAQTESNLANALVQNSEPAKAVLHYAKALKLQPQNAVIQNNLAWVLATSNDASVRNGNEAVKCARRAEELSGGGQPFILRTLAAAYAEAHRFDEAVKTAEQALQLATARGDPALADRIEAELRYYRAGSPYHEGNEPQK